MNINNYKGLMAHIYLRNENAVLGLHDESLLGDGNVLELAKAYEQQCVDALIIFDLSQSDREHRKHLELIRKIVAEVQLPVIAGGHVHTIDDVDKLLQIGCSHVFLNMSKSSNMKLLERAAATFGKDVLAICLSEYYTIDQEREFFKKNASFALLLGDEHHLYDAVRSMPLLCVPLLSTMDNKHISVLMHDSNVMGISGEVVSSKYVDVYGLKERLIAQGVQMHYRQASMSWSDLKLNSDGMVPVIVQDYKNNEVLMMAYMNEEAYNKTVRSGRMTYWSRSRNELWLKGETSGHYQIVKELFIDCDNDTILAKVDQIGAACHTGNRSCFYRTLLKNDYKDSNPLHVFERLYENNMLSNNKLPEREEIVKDVTSVLFHMTRLMAKTGITMDEITDNLTDHND